MIIGQLFQKETQRYTAALSRLKADLLKGAQLLYRLKYCAISIAAGIELHNLRSLTAAGIFHRQRSLHLIPCCDTARSR